MPNDDAVDRNLQGMNELDFVDGTRPIGPASSLTITPTNTRGWQGQPQTHGIEEHIEP